MNNEETPIAEETGSSIVLRDSSGSITVSDVNTHIYGTPSINTIYTGSGTIGSSKLVSNVPSQIHLNLSLTLTHEETTELYDYDIGDLVICKKPGECLGKVGKITGRTLETKFTREGKQINNLAIVGVYYVDFNAKKEQPANNSFTISLAWRDPDPKFFEDEIELVFNK